MDKKECLKNSYIIFVKGMDNKDVWHFRIMNTSYMNTTWLDKTCKWWCDGCDMDIIYEYLKTDDFEILQILPLSNNNHEDQAELNKIKASYIKEYKEKYPDYICDCVKLDRGAIKPTEKACINVRRYVHRINREFEEMCVDNGLCGWNLIYKPDDIFDVTQRALLLWHNEGHKYKFTSRLRFYNNKSNLKEKYGEQAFLYVLFHLPKFQAIDPNDIEFVKDNATDQYKFEHAWNLKTITYRNCKKHYRKTRQTFRM